MHTSTSKMAVQSFIIPQSVHKRFEPILHHNAASPCDTTGLRHKRLTDICYAHKNKNGSQPNNYTRKWLTTCMTHNMKEVPAYVVDGPDGSVPSRAFIRPLLHHSRPSAHLFELQAPDASQLFSFFALQSLQERACGPPGTLHALSSCVKSCGLLLTSPPHAVHSKPRAAPALCGDGAGH